ncbi:MAG: phosphate signaling complex protein PhoU [Anaerolineae bacterium]
MGIRQRFEQQLEELRTDVLKMGSMVEQELQVAMDALEKLDTARAREVFSLDNEVNLIRFEIEEKCFGLIVTQQPAARDLRSIVTVMNMIVDLERMGDQAKGIAKVIPHMVQSPDIPRPAELSQMGIKVGRMLNQTMTAYAHDNIDLASAVARQDDEVDALYARIFGQIMAHMADAKTPDKIEATYEALRAARELERFGDLATNLAERVIYMVTGRFQEINVDRNEAAD